LVLRKLKEHGQSCCLLLLDFSKAFDREDVALCIRKANGMFGSLQVHHGAGARAAARHQLVRDLPGATDWE
jgi:hypothetical protein